MTNSVPILAYHRVSPQVAPGMEPYTVAPAEFAAQMRTLRERGYECVRLDDLLDAREGAARLPERPAVVTFDDGFRDCLEHAVPVLEREGLTATFFVVATLTGDVSRWLLPLVGAGFPLMGWDELRELRGRGFAIGSHTLTHPRLAELDDDACEAELAGSRALLEERLDEPVLHVAYPFGSFDGRVATLARRAGYRSGCTVRPAAASVADGPFELPRLAVRPGADLAALLEAALRPEVVR